MTSDPASISAEFAFVCACAAPGGSPPPDARLNARRIAAIARRHQVVPLVAQAFKRWNSPLPPAIVEVTEPLAPLRAVREALRLRTLLEKDGIAPVFLKGSTLAVLAHGDIGLRQFSDVDLLVDPRDAGRAAGRLEEAGYRVQGGDGGGLAQRVARLTPLAKDIVLQPPDGGLAVELHWRAGDNRREPPIRDREATQLVELAPGIAVPTLAPEALFAYCCSHGAAHGWARLRWLADVAGLLAREPDGGDRLWRAAVARRQRRAAASAIILTGRLFGTPPPPSFRRPASLRLALLLLLSHRVIVAGGGSTELARTAWRGWAEMAAKLLIASSAGDLAGWLRRLLYSSLDDPGSSRWRRLPRPLQRVPRLIERRRRRRRHHG